MLEIGDTVTVVTTPDNCCGVVCQGWRDVVVDVIYDEDHPPIIVLKGGSIHWQHDVEKVKQ